MQIFIVISLLMSSSTRPPFNPWWLLLLYFSRQLSHRHLWFFIQVRAYLPLVLWFVGIIWFFIHNCQKQQVWWFLQFCLPALSLLLLMNRVHLWCWHIWGLERCYKGWNLGAAFQWHLVSGSFSSFDECCW
jgi:hypothetical protein